MSHIISRPPQHKKLVNFFKSSFTPIINHIAVVTQYFDIHTDLADNMNDFFVVMILNSFSKSGETGNSTCKDK